VSDRYDDSRWQGPATEAELDEADVGLDEARENVLEDWPSSLLASDEDAVEGSSGPHDAEPFSAEPAAVVERAEPAEPVGEPLPEVEPFAAHVAAPEEAPPAEAPEPVEAPEPAEAPEPVEHSSVEHAPGDFAVPPGYAVLEGVPEGRRRTVGVVVSRFNAHVTSRLLQSALDELERAGVTHDAITVMPVPGAFELPLAAMALAKTRRFAAVIALGCVIRGDTPHFDYVASEAASGLQLAALETGVPVAFGLLTLDREEQAEHRITKGAEAVRTALEMADLFANLRTAASP
jgi:6,7-dimethyl-8-ribityllumazine synthase